MLKQLLRVVPALLCLLLTAKANAQVSPTTDSLMPHCTLKNSDLMETEVTSPPSGYPEALGPPAAFPPDAIRTCGKFTFYFEDIQLGLPFGYNDPTPGLALQRQNNLCSVAQYIESVFDLSLVSPGGIRIVVNRSNVESMGRPFWDRPPGAHPIIEGFAAEYIRTGIDRAPGTRFHGEIAQYFLWVKPVNTNSDFSVNADACSMDLASEHLHNLAHVLGFFSFIDIDGSGNFATPGPFSRLDMSLHTCPEPKTSLGPMASLTPFVDPFSFTFTPASFYTNNLYWVNGLQAPKNHGINWRDIEAQDIAIHIHDNRAYRPQNRISPGDAQEYVMGQFFGIGAVNRKEFTKGELETFTNIIGFSYNPTYLAAHPNISNTVPHSRKMGSDAYNHVYLEEGAPDVLPADYVITNNIGTTLTINIGADPDLVDADGDPISIFPGSLVNFRGCGQGSNNHNLLSVNPAGTEITYTPREDFYGRAQLGFNLFDSKERGGFVIYTIEVRKGSAVAIPTGENLVLNGSFEEGTEVREFFGSTATTTNNSLTTSGDLHHNRLAEEAIIGDCQPYNYTYGLTEGFLSVHNSCSADCTYATDDIFGDYSSTYSAPLFPWIVAPSPPNVAEHRYQQTSRMGLLFLMGEQLENCKRYELSFYARRNMRSRITYAPREVIKFGFTDDAHINTTAWASWPDHDRSNVGLLYSPTTTPAYKTFNTEEWEKVSIPFNFCADTPVNVLYLNIFSSWFSRPGALIIDSVSIKEITAPFSVIASVANPGECAARLLADPDKLASYGCGTDLYTWRELGTGTIVGTGKEVTVSPIRPTSYVVTADDGCGRIAMDTVEVSPCRCAPSEVLGTASFTTLSGTVPTTLSPGVYYAATDLTVTGTATFNNAILLMEPDVAIFVNNTAKFILDSTHIFTCPDTNRLWAGIRLQSSGSNSARIEVKNGSLIEDAYYAILAQNIKAPSSGNIIDITNSTFNRNRIGLSVNGAYTLGSAGTYPIKVENSLFTARHIDTMAGYPFTWAPNVRLREELATVTNTKAPYKISRDYAKAYLKNDTMAYMGIEFYNTGNTLVPGTSYAEVLIGEPNFAWNRNIIDNMQYGFHSNNSNAVLVNTHIINIGKRMVPDDDTNHSYPSSAGWGIIGRSIGTRTNRVKIGAGANAGVKLYDCYSAIHLEDVADLDIKAVAISSSHTLGDKPVPGTDRSTDWYSGQGITLIGNNNHLKWSVTQDTISNINHGMYVYVGNPITGATTEIKNNMLYDQNRSARFAGLTALQYMLQGITVAGPGLGNSNTVTIKENTLTGVFNGIELNNLKSAVATVENNQLQLSDKTMSTIGTPQFGISALYCQDATISANTVSTSTLGSKVNAINMKGFYASKNTNLRLCGNFTNRIGSAFVFDGKDLQIGTRWIANTINDGWRGMTLASDIGDQGFMYNWRTVPLSSFYGPTLNKWNGFGGLKEQTVTIGYINTMLSKLYVKDLPFGSAERPTINVSDPAGQPFPYLYRFSLTPPESIRVPNGPPSDANCHGALYEQQTSPRPEISAPFRMVGGLGRLVIDDSLGYDSTYRVNQWCNQLAVYELGTIHPELRDSSGTLDTFMIHATGSRFGWLTAINQAIGTGDIITAQSLINTPVSAMGRVIVNCNVTITDYPAANGIVSDYVVYYNTHIRMLQNTINPTDTAVIGAIARKCPPVDGAVVYKARALYQLLTGLTVQYKDDSCAYGMGGHSLFRVAPEEVITGSSEQDYTLFPNPNEGAFSIRQTIPSDKIVEAKIYNALGQELHRETVQFQSGVLNFKLENTVPGLYLVCLTDEQHKVVCLKFNVK